MKVYKFGGASVKNADAVRNVAEIIQQRGEGELWVVISAMGKTTNALESLLEAYRHQFDNREQLLQDCRAFHEEIMKDLFPFGENEVWNTVDHIFSRLKTALQATEGSKNRSHYARVVGHGELLSTHIVSAYLNSQGILNEWLDAREVIRTDESAEEARVDLEGTQRALRKTRDELVASGGITKEGELIVVTQGFIGACNGVMTTLGREGSDYTGGIISWSLEASELSIWKDVPGMLNADPKYFPKAEILDSLSYKEAIELSYYGASVIHPKTLKPLQNKHIPLYVRSFKDPGLPGTRIHDDEGSDTDRPSYIFKQNQVLLSIIPTDFSFIMEDNLSEIFKMMADLGLRADLVQNSALSLSICMDDKGLRVDELRQKLSNAFKVRYNQGLSLITVRHYNEEIIEDLLKDREVLVEQRSRQTARYVVKGGFDLSTPSY